MNLFGGIKCSHCNTINYFKSFKKSKVIITTEHDNKVFTNEFTARCCKCIKCKKILFQGIKEFKNLRKEVDKFYEEQYGFKQVKHTKLDIV